MEPYRRVGFARYPDYVVFIDREGNIVIDVYDEETWATTVIFGPYDFPTSE